MNKLEKDLLFYSNYCMHSNILLMIFLKLLYMIRFYICIDDKKLKFLILLQEFLPFIL